MLNQVLGRMVGEPVPPERWPQVKQMARRENRVVIRARPYATFATPPWHMYQMSDIDTLSHWTSNSMPWVIVAEGAHLDARPACGLGGR